MRAGIATEANIASAGELNFSTKYSPSSEPMEHAARPGYYKVSARAHVDVDVESENVSVHRDSF